MLVYGEEWIWVKPKVDGKNGNGNIYEIPFAAKIQSSDKDKFFIRDDDGQEFSIAKDQILKAIHSTSNETVEDMISMFELEEYTILRNLYMRYKKKEIYTYIGSMLVAINPYEILPIYTVNEINHYKNQLSHLDSPPHIFAIANNAFKEMLSKKHNQCIVISGESGAGKTESTKLILQYLAAVSVKHSWIEQQILESNPIMEAFGNARTIRNDNSSRFGKYIDIYFNENGAIEGAKIEHYLLEKSRIVSASKGERNYHIFYAMLAGLSKDEKRKLELEDASKYNYLTSGGIIKCENRDDANEFMSIRSAMSVLSFTDEEFMEIMKLLSAILHLGNIKYKAITVQNLDACEVTDNVNMTRIASFLGVPRHLLNNTLTQKTILAHGERVISNLSKEQAIEARDAFVKAIYGKIFIMIVEKINITIFKALKKKNSIGVLDIFGFENFDNNNSFEQLCINYANENLQQFFVKYIFKLEQEEYTNEGINWQNIPFVDNQEILDMIGLKPMSIMALINEETIFPKGTDATLVAKLHLTHASKSIYIKPKYENSSNLFGIQHYAGEVVYNPNGFLEKNRDSFNHDLKELVMQSSNRFLLNLFSSDDALDTTKKSITLSLQFRNSLEALMKTLLACDPSFVRCIKPNDVQRPKILDKSLCVRQLRYSGMMETAKIRKAGYAIRHTYKDFVNRYRFLVKGITTKTDVRAAATKICSERLSSLPNFALGKTKIFLKEQHDRHLEKIRSEIYLNAIATIQRGFRRIIFKRFMEKYRHAAIVIQKNWRSRGPRQRFIVMQRGFKRLQAVIQSREATKDYQIMRQLIILLQARCRGFLTRRDLSNKISAKSHRMIELSKLRVQEEQELRSAGHPYWQKEAETRFLSRMSALNKELKIDKEKRIQNQYSHTIEDDDKVIDDVFSFLTELQTPVMRPKTTLKTRHTPTFKDGETTTDDLNSYNEKNEPIPIQQAVKRYKEDLSEYSFQKFAATYFAINVSYQYSKRSLKNSLLDIPLTLQVPAQALWITILRFMGDMGEAKYENDDEDVKKYARHNIMQKFAATLSKNSSMSKEFQGILKGKTEQKLLHGTLRNKNKLSREFIQLVQKNNDLHHYQEWINTRSSHLDKLHFIIGHGILQEQLRDEIYSQVCKQLTNNPNSISFKKGWILLSLCIGCFPPSSKFELYLRQFIRCGPTLYAPYCENKLDRMMQNGVRKQPPSWHELQSSKTKEPIVVTINFMNNTSVQLEIDSASTSEEICLSVAKAINLRDLLGFSLFITIANKVMTLGCEHQFVFDAISRCEQFAKEQGIVERSVKWELFIQKEMFTPWYNPADDPIATDLIFHQIVKGIHLGDYVCTNENDLAMIMALRYYVEYGDKYEKEKMLSRLPEYLPKAIYRKETAAQWEILSSSAFKKCRCVNENLPQVAAKEDIVFFAKITWVLKFSRFFEVLRIDEEEANEQSVIIFAINWSGVYLIDNQEQVLLELSFAEISNLTFKESDDENSYDTFTLFTITGEMLKFKSLESSTIFKWLNYLLTQLKKKSFYAVAIQKFSKIVSEEEKTDDAYLELKKGDLLKLEQPGEMILNSTSLWATGIIKDKKGYFPIDSVIILPCIMAPRKEIVELYAKDGKKHVIQQKSKYNSLQRQKMHNLKRYAQEHFRPNIKIASAFGTINTLRRQHRELYYYSRDPIKAPLLMKLQGDSDRINKAIQMFIFIMKYMGDLPQAKNSLFNTDEIFGPAMKDEILRDELFCQIMKQLTENNIASSEERGWDLLWLGCGIMAPSQGLLKELQEFLKTRPHPVAKECLQRLQKIIKSGNRKYPPYIVEVESIRQRTIQIYHKIYFPDDTDEAFQIESSTKTRDLTDAITKSFNMKSSVGFSLFVKITDKVISVPENYYIFDFIYELVDWAKSQMPLRNDQPIQLHYQLFFIKKLWIDFTPGVDSVADESFYFYQELPKYLNGYYKISRSDAAKLGALIYRVHFGMDKSKFSNHQGLLNMLVPEDLAKEQKIDEWKKQITNIYSRQMELTESECKLEFLKFLQQQPTFGSTFFVVNQKTISSYPIQVLIAINQKGFHIIDRTKKIILKSYSYVEMSFWSSGNTYFQITFGNMMGGTKLLCETNQGYKLDDLLSSYIQYLNSSTKLVQVDFPNTNVSLTIQQ